MRYLFLVLLLPATLHADGIALGRTETPGSMLLNELKCLACHQAKEPVTRLPTREAPRLDGVGQRVTPQYIQSYLADPQKMKPGSPMPHLLHGRKQSDLEALTHFLVSLGGPIDQKKSGASEYQIQQGQKLFHTVGCVACHEPVAKAPDMPTPTKPGIKPPVKPNVPSRPSIPLGELATKTTVEALAKFLRDPLHVRPSGRMPNLKLEQGEANMIAAYLLREQLSKKDTGFGVGLDFALYRGSYSDIPDFEKLKPEQVGTCKQFNLREIRPKKGPLRNNFAIRFHGLINIEKAGRYQFFTRSDDASLLKIDGRIVVNNNGVHPPRNRNGSVNLTVGRHAIEVGFAQVGGGYELKVEWQPPSGRRSAIPAGILLHGAYAMIPKGRIDFKVDNEKATLGRKLFGSIGCASCHSTGKGADAVASTLKAGALTGLDTGNASGCLGKTPGKDVPKYALNDAQRKSLLQAVAARKKGGAKLTNAQLVHQSMTVFNCYACHQRDKVGGIDARRDPYFVPKVPADLGPEGRLPPTLTGIGAKLTKKGFEQYLFQGEPVRTYMSVRMPIFGRDNVGHLPDLFDKLDGGKLPAHKPSFSGRMVDDGRQLVGKSGLGCVNCHAWDGKTIQGIYGLELTRVTERLKPGWFQAFLKNPAQFAPQTRMPQGWPDGQVFFPKIQGGKIDKQIDAIWSYLSMGPKGGIPAGLAPGDEYVLTPITEPIVFRTFISGVGAHAIAVGFRQRTHVVYDALRVRMAKAWTGQFLSARSAWAGRAGQYAPINSGGVIDFPSGSPFAILKSETDGWPTLDRKVKAHPPGWKFRGYRLNKKRIPTFKYRFKEIDIEEEPSTEYLASKAMIRRRFSLTSDKAVDGLYLRVAVGDKVTTASDGTIQVDKLTIKVSGKPVIRKSEGKQEVLLPVNWMRGNSNKMTATLEVVQTW